jgi:hypothetical protein
VSDEQVIVIASEIDIVMARLRVRRYAQTKGLDTKDQASISLVVSSLAHAMDLDGIDRGKVVIDCVCQGGRTGVRVVCSKEYGAVDGLAKELQNARWMVDELTVEALPPTGVRVTAIKWSSSQGGYLASNPGKERPEFTG